MDPFEKLKEYVAESEKLISKAIGEMGPLPRLSLPMAYVLGHLRCVEAGIRNAQDFIKKVESFQSGKTPASKPGPKPGPKTAS